MESAKEQFVSRAFFDREALLWRMGGDVKDAQCLAQVFFGEAKKLFAQISKDVEASDAFALRAQAESLHESASAVSATTIEYLALRMAALAEREDFEAARRLLPKLSSSIRALEGLLRDEGWLA